MKYLDGQLLIASAQLKDPNFYRSVVLMVQHDSQGALGIILNRPTGKSVQDAMQLVTDEPCTCRDPIYLGGPVRGPLVVLHTESDRGNVEVLPGLYYTAEDELVSSLLETVTGPRRIFLGYSGWAPGQLEDELQMGGWLVSPTTTAEVFSEPANLWQVVTRRLSRQFLQAATGARIVPEDPSWN